MLLARLRAAPAGVTDPDLCAGARDAVLAQVAVLTAIKDLDIPRDATIVAVVRSEHVVMPRGDTIFEAGDEVLAMVTHDAEDDVRRILTGS